MGTIFILLVIMQGISIVLMIKYLAHATLFQSLQRNADILDYNIHYHPLALEDELTKGLRDGQG